MKLSGNTSLLKQSIMEILEVIGFCQPPNSCVMDRCGGTCVDAGMAAGMMEKSLDDFKTGDKIKHH